jgi:hypothetical protein
MITPDMDKHITLYTQPRKIEKNGRHIYLTQLDGTKVFGMLVDHRNNVFVIEDFKDNILKEIHRATIVRFMVVLDGGKCGSKCN